MDDSPRVSILVEDPASIPTEEVKESKLGSEWAPLPGVDREKSSLSDHAEGDDKMLTISVGELRKIIQSECEIVVSNKLSASGLTGKDFQQTADVLDIMNGKIAFFTEAEDGSPAAELPAGLDPVYAEAIMKLKKEWDLQSDKGNSSEFSRVAGLIKELYKGGHPEHAAQIACDETLLKLVENAPLLVAATVDSIEYTKKSALEFAENYEEATTTVVDEYHRLLDTEPSCGETMFDLEPEQAKELLLRVLAYMIVDTRPGHILCNAIVQSKSEGMVELRKHVTERFYRNREDLERHFFMGPSMNVMVTDLIQEEMYNMLKRNFEKVSGTKLTSFLIDAGKTMDMAKAYANLTRMITNSVGPMKHDKGMGKMMIYVVCRQAVQSQWGKGLIITLINNDLNLFHEELLKDPEIVKELTSTVREETIKDYKQKIFGSLTKSGPGLQLVQFFRYAYYFLMFVLLAGTLLDCQAIYMGFTTWNDGACNHNINRLWLFVGAVGLLTKYFHPTTVLLRVFTEESANHLVKDIVYGVGEDDAWYMVFYQLFGTEGIVASACFLIEIIMLAMMTVAIPKYGCGDHHFYVESLEFVDFRWLCYSVVLLVIPAQLYLDHLILRLEDGHLPI